MKFYILPTTNGTGGLFCDPSRSRGSGSRLCKLGVFFHALPTRLPAEPAESLSTPFALKSFDDADNHIFASPRRTAMFEISAFSSNLNFRIKTYNLSMKIHFQVNKV